MLRTLNPLALRRAQSQPAPQPETTSELEWAIRTLKDHQKSAGELASLDQQKAADEALLVEIESRQRQRGERRREIERVQAESSRAANIVIRLTSAEPESEKRLTETGIAKNAEASELSVRYREHRAKLDPPEATADYQELQSVLAAIAECDSQIQRENANPHQQPGLSAAQHRLRRLQADSANLQPKVDAYAQEYAKWREIRDVKQQSADAFAERDRLRKEREDAALAKALKSK